MFFCFSFSLSGLQYHQVGTGVEHERVHDESSSPAGDHPWDRDGGKGDDQPKVRFSRACRVARGRPACSPPFVPTASDCHVSWLLQGVAATSSTLWKTKATAKRAACRSGSTWTRAPMSTAGRSRASMATCGMSTQPVRRGGWRESAPGSGKTSLSTAARSRLRSLASGCSKPSRWLCTCSDPTFPTFSNRWTATPSSRLRRTRALTFAVCWPPFPAVHVSTWCP